MVASVATVLRSSSGGNYAFDSRRIIGKKITKRKTRHIDGFSNKSLLDTVIIYWEIGLSKFLQLGNSFDIQENNWRRWAGGKSYLNHLYWNGCMTGRLQDGAIQSAESASDTSDEISKLDAYAFNQIVQWLPEVYRKVYLAYVFNKAVLGGSVKITRAGDVVHQCSILGLTKYKYEQLLERAVGMIKRESGLS